MRKVCPPFVRSPKKWVICHHVLSYIHINIYICILYMVDVRKCEYPPQCATDAHACVLPNGNRTHTHTHNGAVSHERIIIYTLPHASTTLPERIPSTSHPPAYIYIIQYLCSICVVAIVHASGRRRIRGRKIGRTDDGGMCVLCARCYFARPHFAASCARARST